MNNPNPAAMYGVYGSYAISNTFSNNDHVPDQADGMAATHGTSLEMDLSVRRRAACDECRKRKLKCSGEPLGCARCIKLSLTCHYSEQKQMGRPKKRQRTDETCPKASKPNVTTDPLLSARVADQDNFENLCTAPFAQHMARNKHNCGSGSNDSGTPPSDNVTTPPPADIAPYPTDIALWPDFSNTDLPMPVLDKWDSNVPLPNELGYVDPDANPEHLSTLPSIPECPCLPNLYLTLSTLSTLSAFPVSPQTISTLETSLRTAHAVIYCSICPEKFQSGSQNVMITSTLLGVLADAFHRVQKNPASDLRKAFSSTTNPDTGSDLSLLEDLEWRTYTYNLVRAYVFGDAPIPTPPGTHTTVPAHTASTLGGQHAQHTLMGQIEAMERRQRQWHDLDPWTGEFARKAHHDLQAGHAAGLTFEEIQRMQRDTGQMLCMNIVKHMKTVIVALDKPVPTIR